MSPPSKKWFYLDDLFDEEIIEDLAYDLAKYEWYERSGWDGEDWNERLDWKVPCLVYKAKVRTVLTALYTIPGGDDD